MIFKQLFRASWNEEDKRLPFCPKTKTWKIPLIRQIYKRWNSFKPSILLCNKNSNCFLLYISTKFPCGRAMNSAIDYKLTLTWPLPGGSFVHVTTFYFWLRTAWSFRTGSPPCHLGCHPHQTRPPSAGPSPGVKGHQHVNSMMLTIGPITDRDLTACTVTSTTYYMAVFVHHYSKSVDFFNSRSILYIVHKYNEVYLRILNNRQHKLLFFVSV